ncbi:MAG: hypothetical protein V4492_03675 [Chlamydiota bacterium]
MISTSLNLSPVGSSSSILSAPLVDRIPQMAQIAMLKVISLINDIWVSISDCKKCFCGKMAEETPKTTTDIYVEKGGEIIDQQTTFAPMEELRGSSIQVATVLTFKGEIIGVQCNRVNQHSKAAFANHARKVKKDLEQTLGARKVTPWSSVAITTIFVGDSNSGMKKMEYKSAELRDQMSSQRLSTSGKFDEFNASVGSQLLDSLLGDYASTDPHNRKEKLRSFLFGKV